jgi:hypothetical protein
MRDRDSALARLMRETRFEAVYANLEATMSAYGPEAFEFHDRSRAAFSELGANTTYMKWTRPDLFRRIPYVTINASTEDSSLILVGYPSITRARPDAGIDFDFDAYRRDGTPTATYHTGFTAQMRRELGSTGPIRPIGELNRLALHGGLGGLDERGHLRAHHSTGGPTGDPLADWYVARAFEEERRAKR